MFLVWSLTFSTIFWWRLRFSCAILIIECFSLNNQSLVKLEETNWNPKILHHYKTSRSKKNLRWINVSIDKSIQRSKQKLSRRMEIQLETSPAWNLKQKRIVSACNVAYFLNRRAIKLLKDFRSLTHSGTFDEFYYCLKFTYD